MEHSEDQAGRPVAVSSAVVRRLPRYYRYLRELIAQGRTRISSGELSALMNVTASQIRQDLNCFGGFGQQGYGYNVSYLFAKISEILAVGEGFNAVIIGAGDLGRALVHLSMFEKRGVDIIASGGYRGHHLPEGSGKADRREAGCLPRPGALELHGRRAWLCSGRHGGGECPPGRLTHDTQL